MIESITIPLSHAAPTATASGSLSLHPRLRLLLHEEVVSPRGGSPEPPVAERPRLPNAYACRPDRHPDTLLDQRQPLPAASCQPPCLLPRPRRGHPPLRLPPCAFSPPPPRPHPSPLPPGSIASSATPSSTSTAIAPSKTAPLRPGLLSCKLENKTELPANDLTRDLVCHCIGARPALASNPPMPMPFST